MNRTTFERELRKSRTLRELGDRPEYRAGFERGFYVERFGTPEEHALWMGAADSPDPSRAERGLGYRDGFTRSAHPGDQP
jgi:hypothetical protein